MPHINAQWVCNNSEAILHGVEQGFGMTVISRRLAEQRLANGSLYRAVRDGYVAGTAVFRGLA